MRNRFSKSVKSVAEQFDIVCPSEICVREQEKQWVDKYVWTNTLWHTPKKLSHRCMSSPHFNVSKHFDVDNYVRSRFFFADPSLMICMSLMVFSLTQMTECVSHCERNRACIICQKIWFWLPPNTPWCKVILMYQRRKCVSHRQQEKLRWSHLPLSANVNNAKPLQPNAFLAPGLCQIRANTHKQNWLLQPRMPHIYMNAACRSNIRVQHNETDSNMSWSKPKYPIMCTYGQVTADHHHWL